MEPDDRLAAFQAEIDRLKLRGSTPTSEQRLLAIGVVLMPLGALIVFAGWWGASGTRQVSEQVPYLISGGVFGLACTVAGAALFLRYSLARYLRYWLLRLIYEEHATTDRHVAGLDRIATLLDKDA